MRYTRIIVFIAALVLLALVQIGFVKALPGGLSYLNLAIVVLLFLIGLGGLERTLASAFTIGLVFEFYSPQPFGLILFGLFLASTVTWFLFNNYVTDRSLYSFLAMTLAITLVYDLVFYGANFGLSIFDLASVEPDFNFHYFANKGIGVLANMASACLIFYVLAAVRQDLRPVFLKHKRKYG